MLSYYPPFSPASESESSHLTYPRTLPWTSWVPGGWMHRWRLSPDYFRSQQSDYASPRPISSKEGSLLSDLSWDLFSPLLILLHKWNQKQNNSHVSDARRREEGNSRWCMNCQDSMADWTDRSSMETPEWGKRVETNCWRRRARNLAQVFSLCGLWAGLIWGFKKLSE